MASPTVRSPLPKTSPGQGEIVGRPGPRHASRLAEQPPRQGAAIGPDGPARLVIQVEEVEPGVIGSGQAIFGADPPQIGEHRLVARQDEVIAVV